MSSEFLGLGEDSSAAAAASGYRFLPSQNRGEAVVASVEEAEQMYDRLSQKRDERSLGGDCSCTVYFSRGRTEPDATMLSLV